MSKVLVIGAGGVGSVAVHKMAMNSDIFSHITLASRTKAKCDAIADSVKQRTGVTIDTAQIDADDVAATTALIRSVQPALVVNLALPYQDLNIMDACLAAGTNYLDTANYEPRDEAKFEYSWQWAYQDRFRRGRPAWRCSVRGLTPASPRVFTTYGCASIMLDRIDTLDILDCNGGDTWAGLCHQLQPGNQHPRSDRPVRVTGKMASGSKTPAMSHQQVAFDFRSGVGPKNMYLMYHEELESPRDAFLP